MVSCARLLCALFVLMVSSLVSAQEIAVDPKIVESQKVAMRADCKQREVGRPHVDCACFVDRFSDERIRRLKAQIAQAKESERAVCSIGGKTCTEQQRYSAWATSRNAQINFPTREGAPITSSAGRFTIDTNERLFGLVYDTHAAQCANKKPEIVQPTQSCLVRANDGSLPRATGMSAEQFCSCAKAMTAQGMQEERAYAACSN